MLLSSQIVVKGFFQMFAWLRVSFLYLYLDEGLKEV